MTDDPITAATLKCKSACTQDCKLFHARQVIDAKMARGDFDMMISNIDATMREALALAFVRNLEKP